MFYDELDSISDSGWRVCLDDLEKNHNGYTFKNSFLDKMDYYKNDRKNYDDKYLKNKFFSTHPDEKAKLDTLKEDCSRQNNVVSEKEQEMKVITDEYSAHKKNFEAVNNQIEEKEKQIKKEEKRIFGKDKAAERITQLKAEIEELRKQLDVEKDKLLEGDSLIDSKNKEIGIEKTKLSQIFKAIDEIENLALTTR